MNRVVWDTESDGLVDELTKIHCLVLRDLDTNDVLSCADQPRGQPRGWPFAFLGDLNAR